MTGDAVLFIVEQVVESTGVASRFAVLLDIAMLVLLGGKERSREEFAALLAEADMEICTVTPTPTTFSIITARPVRRQSGAALHP